MFVYQQTYRRRPVYIKKINTAILSRNEEKVQLEDYNKSMQKIATRVFIYSSIAFGVLGILLIFTLPGSGERSSELNIVIMKLLWASVFVILPSFALSAAGKYLKDKS